MAKFEPGDIVRFSTRSGIEFGRVVRRDGREYRLFTFSRRQRVVDSRHLQEGRPAVLILESNLSGGKEALLTTKQRRSGIFLEEFFRVMGYEVLREKIHSATSLEYFMKYGRRPEVRFIHWSGHGSADPPGTGFHRITAMEFPAEPLYLPTDPEEYLTFALETNVYRRQKLTKANRSIINQNLKQYERIRNIFSGLEGKILVFSTCEIGKPKGFAEFISRHSGAVAVVTYDGLVDDQEAHLAEVLLYSWLHELATKTKKPGTIVAEVRDLLSESFGRSIPLVCFVKGEKVV